MVVLQVIAEVVAGRPQRSGSWRGSAGTAFRLSDEPARRVHLLDQRGALIDARRSRGGAQRLLLAPPWHVSLTAVNIHETP